MLLTLISFARPAAHDPITTKVTFAREIRAILSARCATCHSSGGSAPMPLTTYGETRPWARAIKEQVLARRMPTWHAARGFGAFKNDPTLTPIEIAMLLSWIDGGLPFSQVNLRAVPVSSSGASAQNPVASAFRRKIGIPAVTVPAGAAEAASPFAARWIAGWSFEPGDPLITSAAFSLADGTIVGNWVAGDDAVTLPRTSAMRISSPVRVQLQRRPRADYEQPFDARPSVLRLITRAKAPVRLVWTEQVTCGTPRMGRAADLIGVRPILADGGAARIWLERTGAPGVVVGWFRNFASRYPRTYWLARPADLSPESRLQADAPCQLHLTLASRWHR